MKAFDQGTMDIQAEESTLGAILIDPACLPDVMQVIKTSDFCLQRHQQIYDAAVALYLENVPLDLLTLATELERRQQLEAIGGVAYLTSLSHVTPTAMNVATYANLVKDTSRRRGLLTVAADLSRLAHDQARPLESGLSAVTSTLLSFSTTNKAASQDLDEMIPPLPDFATFDECLAIGAGKWVDDYVCYAAGASPMTPSMFHESAALWLASVAIARRIVLPMDFDQVYPNLWIAWVAPSTLWGKSTSLNIARRLAEKAFRHLLTPEDMTPEGLIMDMSGQEPANYQLLNQADQENWRMRRDFCAQRGWTLDEMSGLLASSGRDYNAGLIETLLRFYDCSDKYERLTASRGLQCIQGSYLSLLAASTPTALAGTLQEEFLWGKGWWPRFGILTPAQARPAWAIPRQSTSPEPLLRALTGLYTRLPVAQWPTPAPAISATLGAGVFELWNSYNRALRHELLDDGLDPRLWAAYGRHPVHALKVALILAVLDWPTNTRQPCVEIPHLVRALTIVESWRASLHRVLQMVQLEARDRVKQRTLKHIIGVGSIGATVRDLCRILKNCRAAEIQRAIDELLAAEEITEIYSTNHKGPKTKLYIVAR